ncbi:Aldehyde/histidinol dehydrogenase [Clohesyomyces aquaticus]|uniref:Aldehyde/histidinol dehydrogenase n=1 Tax=Clohesyomyces aquaticus TaxID=1231657 RepID=A0A1Y1ZDW4_9PLEO|nr:Aldehyde/histidinol dehydrogenase [Clohesyomyces aquaticus]
MSSITGYTVPLWINGAALSSDSTPTITITNSVSGKAVHHATSASPAQALQAVESSKTAFKSWKRTPHTLRRDLIFRVAAYYEKHAATFIQQQMSETSCDEAWARQNVNLATRYLKEIAACISSVTGVIPNIEKPNTMGFVFKEPVGPVLCIAPWNAALILATRGVASAIAMGCTVVFKASELSPRTHFMITEAFTEAGFPPGVLNQIQTRREDAAEITEKIVAHEAIRKVEFIGSAAVGRIIGQLCAKYLKPILVGLSGKCPAIVLDDADLQEAAKLCALGAAVAEKFQDVLVKAMEGDAVTSHSDAQAKGEKFLVGGAEYSKPLSLKPTILLEPKDSRIVDEETFGPSASLYVVENDEVAIELANRSAYGLNAKIWSTNMEQAVRMARELEYGQVHVNSISVYTSPTASQGGVKGSGFGRQNAKWGLEKFVVDKFVSYHGKGM